MFDAPNDIQPGTVTVLGVPFDDNVSFLKGPAGAPTRIRKVLHNGAANLFSETGVDIGNDHRIRDLGDIEFSLGNDAFFQIESTVRHLVEQGARVLSLGGDHSITYPILKAYAGRYNNLNILQLDAHPDLYDCYDGNPYSHACPFARIMEEKLAQRLVQVGIRTLNPHLLEQAERFGVEVHEMRHWDAVTRFRFDGLLYLSVDMDVLDPAFAPGVSHHEPGGMTTRDVLSLIQNLKGSIVGADLVEFNPERDVSDVTAMTAAKLTKELIGKLLTS